MTAGSRRSWRKVAVAYAVAIVAITALVELTRWSSLGLLGLPAGAFIGWRWQP